MERSYFLFYRGKAFGRETKLSVVTWGKNHVSYEPVSLRETAMKENLVLLDPSGNVLIKRWFQKSVAQLVRENGREQREFINSQIFRIGKRNYFSIPTAKNKIEKAFE